MDRSEDDSSDSDDMKDEIENFDFAKAIIFKENSSFIFRWNAFLVLCSVLSSYMYAIMAVFGFKHSHKEFHTADLAFFVIFTLQIIINCLTEFH